MLTYKGQKFDLNDAEMARATILKQQARAGNLLAFTKYTKPNYQVNWHHKLVSRVIGMWLRGEILRLMIFAPPRHGKSELTSRRVPALIHGLHPNDEILAMSYNSELAADMTIDVQRIMDRPSYFELFPHSKITPEGKMSKYARKANEHELIPYEDDMGVMQYPEGSYRSAGVGGAFTGRGGKWILIDDPVKNRKDADSKTFRDQLHKFYTSSLRSRLEGDDARILLTMTRWHADDLAGKLLREARENPDADQWTVLSLPAIRDTTDDQADPRDLGEPLWPSKFSLDSLLKTKAASSRDWEALYQQRPTAEGGNIVKTDWIQTYVVLPDRFDTLIQSWDFAVKDKSGSDFTVGQVWGRIGANKYLIHQVRGRWSFPDACKKVIEVSQKFPSAAKKLIEAKANGPAVIQMLKHQVHGLVEIEPMGDKVARLNAVAPTYESGNVFYPHPSIAPWITDHITELCDFPSAPNDDQVDAATQALQELNRAVPLYVPIVGHSMGV